MLDLLHAAERELPALLATALGWRSYRIDYHPPFVDRVMREWRDGKLYLHRIHPCAPEEALFHPHPWPSAMRVLEGTYEMTVGHGAGEAAPPIAARLIVSGGMEYEMTDRDGWHAVRPIGGPAMTVMVVGPRWDRLSPHSSKPLLPLSDAEVEAMLAYYRRCYPG
jgi:hypothetical protein